MFGDSPRVLLGQWLRKLILLFSLSAVAPHPQCLDFRPPFKAEPALTNLCYQYSDLGCCTHETDLSIRRQYLIDIFTHDSRDEAIDCQGYMFHMACMPCSPYAAHIYDAEADGVAAPLPGMCRPFCSNFFNSCRRFIHRLTTDSRILAIANRTDSAAASAFCDAVTIADQKYCFPDLVRNRDLNTELVTAFSNSEDCICLEEFASNLRNPLIFRVFPDDSGRIAVAEQVGVVYIYRKDGTRMSEPFMDITRQVLISSFAGDERGFLGLAFHPNFRRNRKFYCYFSVRKSSGQHYTQLREYKVSATNPNKVDLSTDRLILEVFQPYSNHNGGETTFGLDGYLYLFLGDGGAGGDPGNRAQNRSNLLGKALRLDVDVPEGSSERYRIPPDNPFVNDTRYRPEIFAYGLRNPWRCDVDEGDPQTGAGRGRIICGDVGQSAYEEIDIIVKGGNYGWNAREGFECFRRNLCNNIGPEVLPIHAYSHRVGSSVTGGHIYRGCLNPALNGQYIFGDYTNGKLFKLVETSGSWTGKQINTCGPNVCFNGLVSRYEANILSFGEDDDGEVYILTTARPSSSRASGKIYKIVDPRRRGDPSRCRSSEL